MQFLILTAAGHICVLWTHNSHIICNYHKQKSPVEGWGTLRPLTEFLTIMLVNEDRD